MDSGLHPAAAAAAAATYTGAGAGSGGPVSHPYTGRALRASPTTAGPAGDPSG